MSTVEDEFDQIDDDDADGSRGEKLRDAEKAVINHPGAKLVSRLEDLERIFSAWSGFSTGLSRLLTQCETDEQTIVELVMKNIGDTSVRGAITTALDQAVVAYVAGLGALIDHSRIVLKSQSESVNDDHKRRVDALTAKLPQSLFLAKLRTYVLHYVAAPWEFSAEHGPAGSGLTAKVMLNTETLLKIEWQKPAREFIANSGPQIQLSPLLEPYWRAMHALTKALVDSCWAENAEMIEEANELIRDRNLVLSGGITNGEDWRRAWPTWLRT